ncbi:MAG: ArsR/SmtB family transcription factor [Woeseiaceae bacterium]
MSSHVENDRRREEQLDLVFRALSDPTRRKLLARLTDGAAMVTELAKPFDMSLPAVGKHLRVLEGAGLIRRTIQGRVHRCALNPLPLKNAGEWIERYEQFWTETLSALSEYVADDNASASTKKRT